MTYQAQPGTIPHRAIAHLKTLPAGTELSSAVLAESIATSLYGFTTCMKSAREAGLVSSRTKPGNKVLQFWSLGEGSALPGAELDDEADDEPPKRTWVKNPEPVVVEPYRAPSNRNEPGQVWLDSKRAEFSAAKDAALHDQFAMAALAANGSVPDPHTDPDKAHELARRCFGMADVMMKIRGAA